MKAPLKQRRPTPDEALAIATSAAPMQPPALIRPDAAASPAPAPVERDEASTFNLRMRRSTIQGIEKHARERGLTMKQVVASALRSAGVPVADADLEDRTPRRR